MLKEKHVAVIEKLIADSDWNSDHCVFTSLTKEEIGIAKEALELIKEEFYNREMNRDMVKEGKHKV